MAFCSFTADFDTYFAEGLSFRPFEKYRYENPELKVLVLTANPEVTAKEQITKHNLDFDVVSDESMDIANFFGVNNWESSNGAAHVYIADKDNKIVYTMKDYRGEGEKLKDIQSKLYSMLDLKEDLSDNEYPLLIHGDNARDFDFKYVNNIITAAGNFTMSDGRLSDYYGNKNVLIAFYPAPYSLSCSGEITKFDAYAEQKLMDRIGSSMQDDLELLMVSVSNHYILEKWKKDMGFDNVKLVSDDNGVISMKYNSYNTLGWNKRTVFLINKHGKVQYIDRDYNVDDDNDFGILKEQITASK